MEVEIEQVTPALATHGEGPFWDDRINRLLWLDMHSATIYLTEPGGETESWQIQEQAVTMVRARTGSGYIIAGSNDLYVADCFGGTLEHVARVEQRESSRLNEGTCAPDGSVWIGSMALYKLPQKWEGK